MRYLSICSGIEAASVAWHGLGWTPVAFSEIEPFPSAVLAHHYPHVPNLGDMTNFKEWNLGPIDLLVGGTPCQSFSVAGLRKGLHDPRGGLMLTFLEIAQRYRPRWVVWENVPGVLSSNGGRDFGAFLGALGELGYGWAYRVLDARWFGVAQRRRRCFVVGCFGDQASAAAVLFESESVCRYFEKSGKARQGVARGVGGGPADGSIAFVDVGATLKGGSGARGYPDPSDGNGHNMVAQPVAGSHWDHPSNPHPTLNQSHNTGGIAASDQELFSQRGSGLVPQPVAFAKTHKPMSATDAEGWSPVDAAPTVTHWPRDRSDAGTDVAVVQPLNFYGGNKRADRTEGGFYVKAEQTSKTLDAASGLNPTCSQGGTAVMTAMQVRRLTPVECERLQGFPDGYTNIPWRKKPEAPDGPRYKALGNSMAVPCMKWIGERIQAVTARREVKP